RRLLILVSVIVFADTMLFAAIIPLLPVFADEFGLSKLQAGVRVGAYGAGAMVGGVPSGFLVARIGAKRTVVLGLVGLALASFAFAIAGGPALLGVCRFAQGVASAITWAGALAWLTLSTPREQRGKTLGTAFAFAVLGFIVGPVVGAAAEQTSIELAFTVIAVVAALLALAASTFPAGRHEVRAAGALGRAFRDSRFVAALWLSLLPAFFFGVVDVLVPLALDADGWNSVAIAATFVVAGLVEVRLAPVVGGFSDQRGRLAPIRVGLAALVGVATAFALATPTLLIAALVVCAGIAVSGIYTPAIALVSDRAERSLMPQTLGFGVMNTAWAFGAMAGPAVGGGLATAAGDAAPYLLCAGLALVTLLVVARPAGLRRLA
ncbi:MAG: MFS transporter, partial [Gaiella sp.]